MIKLWMHELSGYSVGVLCAAMLFLPPNKWYWTTAGVIIISTALVASFCSAREERERRRKGEA